jgi:hypothetical protein
MSGTDVLPLDLLHRIERNDPQASNSSPFFLIKTVQTHTSPIIADYASRPARHVFEQQRLQKLGRYGCGCTRACSGQEHVFNNHRLKREQHHVRWFAALAGASRIAHVSALSRPLVQQHHFR